MKTSTPPSLHECPIPNTHQRLRQAHLLWHQAAENYQDVDRFLTNVNGLIQELRNITFILQSEKSKFPDFDRWYQPWQERLKNDNHARWLKEARNLVVKQGALIAASRFNVRFLTYYSIDVVCLLSEKDLAVSTVLTREDFRGVVARLRTAMEGQGDAVLSIERCWSTPELMGAELLGVLGEQYGLLASMVLDAHVKIGHLDCVSGMNEDSEDPHFPAQHGRSYLLPCMMRAQASRTDFFKLSNLEQMLQGSRTISAPVNEADAAWRYQFTDAEKMKTLDSMDPLKYYEYIVYSSKKMLRKDRSLARFMLMRDGRGQWNGHMIMAEDRVEKYLLMHLLAQTVREEGCDALIEVGEIWLAHQDLTKAILLDTIDKMPNKEEAISVRLATRDGLKKHAVTTFTRGPFGGIRIGDTNEREKEEVAYLAPIYRVWHEQNQYELSKGAKAPVWHPDVSAPCLCGNELPFGVCCSPIIDGPDGSLLNSDDLLSNGKVELAERHARAAIAQYARWVRQHTALSLNSSHRDFFEKMTPTDCLALEANVAKLERWAMVTGNQDAVLRTYRRLQEFIGVPVIARRLIALGAQWLLKIGQIEEGLLELGRLGKASDMIDSKAILLSVRYGDHDPQEEIGLLKAAGSFALDNVERDSVRLRLAEHLVKQGLQSGALIYIDEVLKQSAEPTVVRNATALKWECSGADSDFARLLALMQSEKEEEDRLSAAAYLIAHGKEDAALEILKSLIEQGNPAASLIATECEILSGNCASAAKRLLSLRVDASNAIETRSGFSYLQAKLVLACGREDLRQSAIQQLQEVLSIKPDSALAELLLSLRR
jgi:hypothetical protein